jgi:zinc protease
MKFWYTLLLGLVAQSLLFAQAPLPLSPRLKTGKLENGLTYYIIPNKKPEKKVELRLVVNAGSINEDDDQQGLAHMVEHMAFNGTTNFKKNDIISFLQDLGVGFGNDLNAYTSFDETVYILPIPLSKPGNLEKGFQVLEDWAHNVTFRDEDIDGERPIILEESRLGKGANDRILKQLLPRLFRGSLYANRLPIGVDSIIQHFPYDAIRRYYRDWYRPDLMAVVVVGDITVADAEKYIKKHFARIKKTSNVRERKYANVPPYPSDDFLIATDKEATSYNVEVRYSQFKDNPIQTEGDYRNSIIRSLFSTLMNQRFQELTQRENPPFAGAFLRYGSYARGYNGITISASSGTSNPSTAIEAALNEVERASRFGFTSNELDRVKKSYLAGIERRFNNRDKTESGEFTEECIRHFLEGEAMPGIELEYNLTKQMLPNIKVEEINALFEGVKGQKNRLVSVTGPESTDAKFTLPDSTSLSAILTRVENNKDLKAYEEKNVAASLLAKEPKAGKVVRKVVDKKTGTTELTLSNGVTVLLKKTDFKNDEIVLSAGRFGGKNNYNLNDKYSAEYATAVQAAMGYGEFSPTDMRKTMAGKTAAINPIFTDTRDGFSGNSSVKDFEPMLQLLYLNVTAPRTDTSLFNSYKQKNKSQLAMLAANPQAAFIDTFYKAVFNNNPLAPVVVPKPAYFDAINLKRAQEIYNTHFGDMSGMQFAIVGNIDEAKAIPLIEKYIGSLPASKKKFTFVDNQVRTAQGRVDLNAFKGKEEKSLILAVFSGETTYSEDAALKADALTEVLNIRIIEELREKVQGIYGGGIFGQLQKYPYAGYSFIAQLPTGPEKVDTLTKALLTEIEKVRKEGIDASYLDKVKKQWKESHKETIKRNSSWANNLIDSRVEGQSIDRFLQYEKYVDALTVKDIQDAAGKYLPANNLLIAALQPEKYDPAKQLVTNNRKNNVLRTIDLKSPEIKIELFDNGEVDGDEVTIFFNGTSVSSKQKLTEKAITIDLKAIRGAGNELVMFAENLGTIPPNSALMKITVNGNETFEVRIESDESQNGAVRFNLK